jgi:hypothetical protein
LKNILNTESIHPEKVLPLDRQINSQLKCTHLNILRSKICLKCKLELRRIENFFKKFHNLRQNLWILNSKTASNLQNLFAYSRVKPVSDGCFLY